jgi:hypothetical protein
MITTVQDISIPVTSEACDICSKDKQNPQNLNKVTCSIAISYLSKHGLLEERHKALFACAADPIVEEGPGTELEKLIGWLATSDCNCNARKFQMNAWGVRGCLDNLLVIIGWLTEEADKRKLVARYIPGFKLAIRLLVRYAIWRATRVSESVPNQPCNQT